MATATAGEQLVVRVPVARATHSVGEVLDRLRSARYDTADTVYVVDGAGRLEGRIPLTELLAEGGYRKVGSLMQREPPHVHRSADPEQVARVALAHGIPSVPVIDEEGVLLGVVPARAILETLRREPLEHRHLPAGSGAGSGAAVSARAEPPPRWLRDRLPWLLVGLLGGTLATLLIAAC